MKIRGIDEKTNLSALGKVKAKIYIGETPFQHEFHIMNKNFNLKSDGIIGHNFLERFGATISYVGEIITFEIPNKSKRFASNQPVKPANEKTIKSYRNRILEYKDPYLEYENAIREYVKSENEKYETHHNGAIIRSAKTIKKQRGKRNGEFYHELSPNYFDNQFEVNPEPINFEQSIETNEWVRKILRAEKNVIVDFNFDKIPITKPIERKNILMNELDKTTLNEEFIPIIEQLCVEYSDVFFIEGDELKPTNVVEHKIELIEETNPICTRQYRLPESHRVEIQRQVTELEKRGIIEVSQSEWNSPVLLTDKRSERSDVKQYRMVIDYKRVNAVIKKPSFPAPIIEDILDSLAQTKYFSCFDVRNAYHQVPLSEESKQYTAFSAGYNRYQFTRSPFGLATSGHVWCETIARVLNDMLGKNVLTYIDDIIIYTKDIESNLILIKKIFKRLMENNMKIKMKKAKFFQGEIDFLGFHLSKEGVLPSKEKIECIERFPRPKNLLELQRFLGLCAYFRKHVEKFAEKAQSLYSLTRKNMPFLWDESCQMAFETLKRALITPPVLTYVRFNERLNLFCDASFSAIGSVLTNGIIPNDKPIAYFSKSLTDTQKRYSAIEKEMASIIISIQKFNYYLANRKFLLATDSLPIVHMFKSKNVSNRIHRWRFILLQYDFDIYHIKGKDNVAADALSRIEISNSDGDDENDINKINLITTRSKAKQNDMNETSSKEPTTRDSTYIIIERNNLLTNLNDFDQAFYMFTHINCRMQKQIQHKMKIKFNFDKSGNFFKINEKMTVIFFRQTILNDEQIREAKNILQKIVIMSGEKQFENIAINTDFTDARSYLKFKQLIREMLHKTDINCTIFLNKIMEINDINDINNIMYDYHSSMLSAHPGYARTLNNIRRYYNWPNMTRDIRNYVQKCANCEKSKIVKHNYAPMMISQINYLESFAEIFVDTVGPINPKTDKGNAHILTVVCALTKFAVAVPLPDITSEVVARALIHNVFLKYNFPKIITSDNSTTFIAETLKNVTKLLKIKKNANHSI